MRDVVNIKSGMEGRHNFIQRSCKIDVALITPGIELKFACFFPFYFRVGDY